MNGKTNNLRGHKVTGDTGIPGTGISYRQRLDTPPTELGAGKSRIGVGRVVWMFILLAVLELLLG